MSGQAVVTIGENVWAVSVASSINELLSGLSGVESIPANTGILFDMASDQEHISINMADMLFNLDIVFINSELGVVGVLHDVSPNESAAFDAGGGLGARYFMEVNAGELIGVEVGDNVDISGYTPSTGIDLGQVIQLMVVAGAIGMVAKEVLKPRRQP